MEGFNSFERAGLYVSLHAYLSWVAGGGGGPPVEVFNFFESLGVELPREIGRETSEYVRNFRAGDARDDLNPVARANLPNHLAAFYKASGYVSTEPADSLTTMTAFAARLAMDAYTAHVRGDGEADRVERQLHRFIQTHLLPTLEHVKPPGKVFEEAFDGLVRIVRLDTHFLAERLSRQRSSVA